LRDAFEDELRTYVKEHDWGNVRIVEGRSLRGFEQEIGEIMEDIANRDSN
jgi:ubiquinone biosynthesis protein COQ9